MKALSSVGVMAALISFAVAPAGAADDPRVSAEVMALARAQWVAEIGKQPAATQLSSLAEDYTEFNPDYPTRLDGKELAVRMLSVTPDVVSVVSEMQNAKVQTYGDTAILTYNFVGLNRGGDRKLTPNSAKSTRVYVRQNGRWMLVHANFAPVAAASQP